MPVSQVPVTQGNLKNMVETRYIAWEVSFHDNAVYFSELNVNDKKWVENILKGYKRQGCKKSQKVNI